MIARSFDAATSREMVGDERARAIEEKARADADLGLDAYEPPAPQSKGTYWGNRQDDFAHQTYTAQFTRRLERNARKAAQP